MSESKVSCPHCNQHIQLDDTWAGKTIQCPTCQQSFEVPSAPPAATPPPAAGLRINRPAEASPAPPPPVARATPGARPATANAPRTSGLAIASLVLSFFGCLAIGGVVCGHLARRQIRRDPSLGGSGLALAGLIIGYISIAFTLAFGFFVGGAFVKGFQAARGQMARSQTSQGRMASGTSPERGTTRSAQQPALPVPDGAVAGDIKGQAFTYSKSSFATNMSLLTVSDGEDFFADREVKIFLFAKPGETLENRTWTINAASKGMKPHVHLTWQENDNRRTEIISSGYELELKTGAISEGGITGSLSLKSTDKVPVELKGNFNAVIK